MAEPLTFSEAVVQAHELGIRAVRFLPGGRRAVSTAFDCHVKLWDVRAATWLHSFAPLPRIYTGLTLSPNGLYLVAWDDSVARVWALGSGRMIVEAGGNFLGVPANGRWLVTEMDWVHDVQVREIESGRLLATLELGSPKARVDYHPYMEDMTPDEILAHTPSAIIGEPVLASGERLVVPTEEHAIYLFDSNTWEREKAIRGRDLKMIHPNGHTAFAKDYRYPALKVFDLDDDGAGDVTLDQVDGDAVFLPDGRLVTAHAEKRLLRVWDGESWRCQRTIKNAHDRSIDRLVALPGGRSVAAASRKHPQPRAWDVDRGTAVPLDAGAAEADSGIDELRLHPRGLLARSGDCLRLWEPESGELVFERRFAASIGTMDVAADGGIVCGDSRGQLVFLRPDHEQHGLFD